MRPRLVTSPPPAKPRPARLAVVPDPVGYLVLFVSGVAGRQAVLGRFELEADARAYALTFAAESGIGGRAAA